LPNTSRLSGLDGLRALCMLLVILHHQQVIGFGWVGVQVFFVLSGYLITRLLWRDRQTAFGPYLRGFWGRRVLRTFPLYFGFLAVLAAGVLAGKLGAGVKSALPFLATYSYNFLWSVKASPPSYYFGHLWTLCVEEQFYLLWPLLIYAVRSGGLRRLLIAVVMAGPLVRLAELLILRHPALPPERNLTVAMYNLTPTYFDAFAAGAYVAIFPVRRPLAGFLAALALTVVTLAVVFGAGLDVRDPGGFGPGGTVVWGFSLLSVMAALLIQCLAEGRLAPGFFDLRVLRYLGTITYGLYVFHFPVQWGIDGLMPQQPVVVRLLLECALTVALAAASFHLWERPFLVLKDRWFPLHRTAPPPGDS
jgi:peptidoglycan/LPS O-acetylase OafA/YrhL